jgi:hypothetical protein
MGGNLIRDQVCLQGLLGSLPDMVASYVERDSGIQGEFNRGKIALGLPKPAADKVMLRLHTAQCLRAALW